LNRNKQTVLLDSLNCNHCKNSITYKVINWLFY
jgi:hypothetical protein